MYFDMIAYERAVLWPAIALRNYRIDKWFQCCRGYSVFPISSVDSFIDVVDSDTEIKDIMSLLVA